VSKARKVDQPTILNRRARFEYEIMEELDAGIVLSGTEVKSLRAGKANVQDAFAIHKEGEMWLHNLHIAEYHGGNRFNHEPKRPRKLLLKKREIKKLIGLLQTKGLTLVPLMLFFSDKGLVKVKMAVGRGKKAHDKRESEKERDWQREKGRVMKQDARD
jgi:SsrA-binding protein